MVIYLFGFLEHDFYGRVMLTPDATTVGRLAAQLNSWGPTPEYHGPFAVSNEAGTALDLDATVGDAGLGNGAIFRVGRP
jgi:hypothetical protein